MKTSILAPVAALALYTLVGTMEYQPPEPIDDYGAFLTISQPLETPQPPENPEFSLSKYVEKRACVPLADMLRELEPLHWPENVLSVGVEFVLSILDCRWRQI